MNSNKKIIRFIFIISIIVGIGLGGYLGYEYYRDKSDENELKRNTNYQEIEITNQDIKLKLLNLVSIVEKVGLVNNNHQINSIYECKDKIYAKDISEEDKFVSIIHSLENRKDIMNKASFEIVKKYSDEMGYIVESEEDYMVDLYYTIDLLELKKIYIDIFGDELKSLNNIAMYPQIYLDEENNQVLVDYEDHGGLGTYTEELETFNIKIAEDENYYYVYMAAGLKVFDEYKEHCTYYYDVEENHKYAEIPCDAETITTNINRDNYRNFSLYKLAFRKDSSNTFDYIQKISEKDL